MPVDVENLTVSITKNGYLKAARLVQAYPSNEILDHTRGDIPGVNLIRSQVARILCADPHTDMVPGFWDQLRRYDFDTIRAFVFVAVVFSHHRLIQIFRDAGHGGPEGTIVREDMSAKEYTNLQFAMAEVRLCEYARATDQVGYSMTPLTNQLQGVGDLVGRLFRAKLRQCGWRDPSEFPIAPDPPLAAQCVAAGFNEVLGLSPRQFTRWIAGRPTQAR